MERLDNIMRTSRQYRSPQGPNQGPRHQMSRQEQDVDQTERGRTSQALPRRPFPEQTTRPGQASSYASQPPPARNNPIQQRPSPPARNMAENPYPPQPSRRGYDRVSDYYEGYGPAFKAGVQADVQNEWEEDDAAAMRYGDWEDDGANDVPRSRPEVGRTHVVQEANWRPTRVIPQPNSPLVTRELPPGLEGPPSMVKASELRSPLTPHLREARLMQGQPPAPEPPQQALPPNMRRMQHMTQPLNPRTVIGVQPSTPQSVMVPRAAMEAMRPSSEGRIQSTEYSSLPVPSTSRSLTTSRPKSMGVCPKCKGAGYLRAELPFSDPHFGKPVPCECKEAEQKEKQRQQLLVLSDLSAFQNRSFESFNPRFRGGHPSVQEAYQEARRFAQSPDGWLVLVGPNGCGKTHLAAAIANHSLCEGAVVLFTVVPDLLAHLRATFGPTATEAYDQRFAKMREAELLVLDDLGAHQSSPWANEKLFQLLNYRYNSCFPTVITANQQGLMGLDERIRSRMTDTALVTTVVMNGAVDYRPHNPRREPMR